MHKPATIEKIKEELIARAKNQTHPMEMTRVSDVRKACAELKSLDSDDWCRIWSDLAKPFEEKAQKQELIGNRSAAERSYKLAYNYYRMARFTVPNTPAKKAAYRLSVSNFVKASKYFDPPLERVVIPFAGKKGEGKEIPVYLRKPSGVKRPPVLINHAGVDVFKEEQVLVDSAFHEKGIATLAMDMPGTGEAPILGSIDAERLYDPIIEYVKNRKDLDGSRVALMGMSFGGYWATKLAHVRREKLTAVVTWGGGTHFGFQPEWQPECRYAPSHLCIEDLIITRAHAFGIHDYDEWVEYVPGLSLLTQGILDQPCAPLLLVNGKNDLHWPVKDIYILLEYGSPKTVRLFPGGHMGNTPQTLPTIVDWVVSRLQP